MLGIVHAQRQSQRRQRVRIFFQPGFGRVVKIVFVGQNFFDPLGVKIELIDEVIGRRKTRHRWHSRQFLIGGVGNQRWSIRQSQRSQRHDRE